MLGQVVCGPHDECIRVGNHQKLFIPPFFDGIG